MLDKNISTWGTVVVTEDNRKLIFSHSFRNREEKIISVLEANRKALKMSRIRSKSKYWVSLHYHIDIYQLLGLRK